MIISEFDQYFLRTNKSGIYWIRNLINQKIYIGSAVSFRVRFKVHKHCLETNTNSHYLQNSWNEHGGNNFVFEVIEVIDDKNNLVKREQFWLDFFGVTKRKNGYNLSPTASSTLGVKHRQETKDRWSKQRKGSWSEERKANMAKFTQQRCTGVKRPKEFCEENAIKLRKSCGKSYKLKSPDGKIYEGQGLMEFCRKMNLDRQSIRFLIKGKYNQYKGWTSLNNENIKYYKFLDPHGNLIEVVFKSLTDFCQKNNLDRYSMWKVWTGEFLNHKGYTRFDTTNGHYQFLDPNGKLVKVGRRYLQTFCDQEGLSSGCMGQVHSGKRKSYKGWAKYESIN